MVSTFDSAVTTYRRSGYRGLARAPEASGTCEGTDYRERVELTWKVIATERMGNKIGIFTAQMNRSEVLASTSWGCTVLRSAENSEELPAGKKCWENLLLFILSKAPEGLAKGEGAAEDPAGVFLLRQKGSEKRTLS